MTPFSYHRAASLADAKRALAQPGAQVLAGGTTMTDLLKLDVLRPSLLVDILSLPDLTQVSLDHGRLRIGALARMADVARDPAVREHAPVIAASLDLAASAQIRNMATIGGNILQRTRCAYFRDPSSYRACNRRSPGSGCAAEGGATHNHAVLGTTDACLAAYPGDLGVALAALDALVHTDMRDIPFSGLFRDAGNGEGRDTVLSPEEIILGVSFRTGPAVARSSYLKVRDRQSYEFAAVSVALALDVDGRERDIRIAVGGVATRPWRLHAVEHALSEGPLDRERIRAAAGLAAIDAVTTRDNAHKVTLLCRAVERALATALGV